MHKYIYIYSINVYIYHHPIVISFFSRKAFFAQGTWIARGKAAAIITAASMGLCPQAASCNGNFPGICEICQDSSWFFVPFARLNKKGKRIEIPK